MILALSVENTNLVLGVFQGEELLFTSRMADGTGAKPGMNMQ